MSNLYQCFYVYFQMLDIFTFYVFVVLPKFLLLAVHCRYRLCLCMRLDSVITGRLNSDELLFRITQASIEFITCAENMTPIIFLFFLMWCVLKITKYDTICCKCLKTWNFMFSSFKMCVISTSRLYLTMSFGIKNFQCLEFIRTT